MEKKEVEKLDHKIDYIERIEELEAEVKRMTDQAAQRRNPDGDQHAVAF